jgi:hypothetical protein
MLEVGNDAQDTMPGMTDELRHSCQASAGSYPAFVSLLTFCISLLLTDLRQAGVLDSQ